MHPAGYGRRVGFGGGPAGTETGVQPPMPDDEGPRLSLLQRREIEARIVGPLVRAMRDELGEEKSLALLRRVIGELARQSGRDLARSLGDASLAAFSICLGHWSEGGALEIDLLEQSADRL